MKLTNLSLAVMVAVGVAACGGSGDDNSNKPADPPKQPTPNQPQQPQQPEAPTNPQQAVDPTGTHVVDDKDLTKQNTVGTLQYIRRDGSQYDRALNPSKPASASPLLGTTLNEQNPRLTNIVLARQDITRTDGTPVKAQFTGSDNPMPLKLDGTAIYDSQDEGNAVDGGRSLQEENFANVDALVSHKVVDNTIAGVENKEHKHLNSDNILSGTNANRTAKHESGLVYKEVVEGTLSQHAFGPTNGQTGERARGSSRVTAILSVPNEGKGVKGGKDGDRTNGEYSKVDKDGNPYFDYQKERTVGTEKYHTVSVVDDINVANAESRFGKGLVWWSSPITGFENSYSRNESDHWDMPQTDGADETANRDGTITPNEAKQFERDSKAATSGLIRVGGNLPTLGEELTFNKETKKWEDHHKTTTRIFGRYHLATAINKDGKALVKPLAVNSFSGVKSFTAEYKEGDTTKKATQYSIGAVPNTLQYVQYGRVTTNLDLDAGKDGYPDGFIRSRFGKKGDDNTVDDYFYRGTDATTIEQMAALPSNQTAVYNGHALMYGIDNSYHGSGGRNLPNAFAGTASGIGLGNFVEARVDFGKKRVLGEVYNEWLLDPSKAATTRDKLVRFQGDITGNTVVGSADRTYVAGDDCAIFKASFFGEKAEEMGGSFNTVQDTSKYGDAYGQNDWGGVFGASKGSSTSNTFQGDDGNNNYGQNNYSQL